MIDSNHNNSSLLDYTDVHPAAGKNHAEIAASDAGNSFNVRPDNESIENDGKKANLLMASAPALQQN